MFPNALIFIALSFLFVYHSSLHPNPFFLFPSEITKQFELPTWANDVNAQAAFTRTMNLLDIPEISHSSPVDRHSLVLLFTAHSPKEPGIPKAFACIYSVFASGMLFGIMHDAEIPATWAWGTTSVTVHKHYGFPF